MQGKSAGYGLCSWYVVPRMHQLGCFTRKTADHELMHGRACQIGAITVGAMGCMHVTP